VGGGVGGGGGGGVGGSRESVPLNIRSEVRLNLINSKRVITSD
jgi:hypothetical protein